MFDEIRNRIEAAETIAELNAVHTDYKKLIEAGAFKASTNDFIKLMDIYNDLNQLFINRLGRIRKVI